MFNYIIIMFDFSITAKQFPQGVSYTRLWKILKTVSVEIEIQVYKRRIREYRLKTLNRNVVAKEKSQSGNKKQKKEKQEKCYVGKGKHSKIKLGLAKGKQ